MDTTRKAQVMNITEWSVFGNVDTTRKAQVMNITEWSGLGNVETTRKAHDMNYWRQFVASAKQWMEPDDND